MYARGLSIVFLLCVLPALAAETVFIEAEHLKGIKGYCWPSGRPEIKKTAGHWGISGPGWAAEWVQGGESGFLSIACGADDDKAVASTEFEAPVAGEYRVWVRFRDNRGMSSRFQVRLTSEGKTTTLDYGTKPVIDDDNEMKLYWNWSFAWEGHPVALAKGPVKLELLSAVKEKECRQIDCFVITTDAKFRPFIKDRPEHPAWGVLNSFKNGGAAKLEPLAKKTGEWNAPAAWKPRTFRDKGFLYLWNMRDVKWAGDDPKRVPFPYQVGDKETEVAFEKEYAGAKEVPIFSDPRVTPVFLGPGPYVLDTEGDPKAKKGGNAMAKDFVKWLDANPDRAWGLLQNYQPDNPLSASGKANFAKYRDRFVGAVAGESIGYFYPKPEVIEAATKNAKTRRELVEAMTKVVMDANAAKMKAVFGEVPPDHYKEVIPCQSVGMTAFAPLCYQWGARTVGYESAAITSGLLPMRMAFLRGAARQNGGLTATYRSCNFGDSATIFSEQSSYTKPKNILDNYYSVYSGAGMTWYKMDIWQQYLAGSSMFYHEQGFDEFWMPGGTTAAGQHPLQLSPKGKLVDRFLKITAQHKDRGTPFTPVAFLVDYAHGWEPTGFHPNLWDDYPKRPDLTAHGDHSQMIREYLWCAYHPIGAKNMEPTTAINEVIVPGVFGDVFDVIYAYPDVKKWTTIDHYPVVVIAGDIELTAAEGQRLVQYVENGGTLVVADTHLTGPGLASLKLPEMGKMKEASDYRWAGSPVKAPVGVNLRVEASRQSQRFRYRPITGGHALAVTGDVDLADAFCSSFDRGKGRLIMLAVPRGLGIDRCAHPAVAHLLGRLTRNLTPVEVHGDVEWMLNKTDAGWIVTLMNPAGAVRPQQGLFPTDFRENRTVTIRAKVPVSSASDWLAPRDTFKLEKNEKESAVELTVLAGSMRVVELKP